MVALLNAALLLASWPPPANAGAVDATPVVLKVASGFPRGFRAFDTLDAAARAVTAKSEGRVRIEWVGGTSLGANDLPSLLSGELAAAVIPHAMLGAQAPTASVFALPLAFESLDEARFVVDELSAAITSELAPAGLESIAYAGMGFAYLAAKRPVATPEALRTTRLWTPKQPAAEGFDFSSTGATGVPLAFDEVEKALAVPSDAENSVECVIGLPDLAIMKGWHRHLTFVLDLPLFLVDFRFVARSAALEPLSEADRDLFREEFGAAFAAIDADRKSRASAFRRVFERGGSTIHTPTQAERDAWLAWRDSMSATFAKDRKIPDGAMSALAAARAQFRSRK